MRIASSVRIMPLAAAIVLLAGCSGQKKQQPQRGPAEVGVVTLKAERVETTTELTGRTNPTLASDVRPQVDGLILKRLFTEGTIVHAGQPLYQIDPRQYRASRDQAAGLLENSQATYAAAQAQAERYRALTDINAVSKQAIDNAVAQAREAKASIHQNAASLYAAKVNLDYTLVRAPITGRISRSAVTPGALVTASQTTALATIQQLDPIYVDIVQSSDALLALRRSLAKGSVLPSAATVQLKLSDGSAYPHTGRIEFAEVTVDETTGTVTLRARMPNPEGILLPGMFVRVEAAQGIVPNGILAPQQGITRDPKGNATALVVGPDNKVAQRTVFTKQAIGDKWLITSGLKPGDRLVVEGTDKAQPGAVVKPVPAGNLG
ncbi:efflux RND transporter periplasmic adaptor subunit [Sphingomonas nostoxanthinifaciens]|uniref:efflux RND transporter periplasmic adaptor subunit n=1 Tax=Sphingomonas nostoxanthinifaciens TaxID=2872652 RepID=UPI001CC1D11F|nr:efflux RND transporter periplasmic adaptor subunit [Sphingomonas nostoxanthinifaciens]UAK25068.1 efflux RND transporter periplasmic adaptor subunit [Sphingomonas nostoxanthinifaciens]